MWRRFRRNLFSGFYLFVLIMLIEILLIVFVHFFMDNVFDLIWPESDVAFWVSIAWGFIRIVESIACFILFFKVLNRQEDPEFKIAWLVGIFILPLFVLTMYIIFGNHGLSIREKRVIDISRATYTPYLKQEMKQEDKEDFLGQLGRASGTFKYLRSTCNMGVHAHNRLTYYKNGEEFFPAFIEGLKQAKEFIFIEFSFDESHVLTEEDDH